MLRLPRDWSASPTPIRLFVSDAAGAGVGSLTFATSGLILDYSANDGSTWTLITKATATLGTYTSGGFVAGSEAGRYWLGLPVAALPEGGRCLVRWAYNGVSRIAEIRADLAPTTLTAARAVNLDATVSSRSTYAGADTPGTTTLLARVPATLATAEQDTLDNANVLAAIQSVPGLTWAYTGAARTLTSFGTLVVDVAAAVWANATGLLVAALATRNPDPLAKPGEGLTGPERAMLALAGAGGGGGGGVLVLPLTLRAVAETYAANGSHRLNLSCLQTEAARFVFAVTDSTGVAIDLVGRSLRFVVRDANFSDAFAAETGDGIQPGDASNVVRVGLTPEQTDRRGEDNHDWNGQWVLWDLANDTALGRGAFRIVAAVKDVA